jgi:DNA polymerase V
MNFSSQDQSGFPPSTENPLERNLNLNEFLISHPTSTFFMRVKGDSMTGSGIHDGDLLIVDRSLKAQDKKVVIAIWNGEFAVKRLRRKETRFFLESTGPGYPTWEITSDSDFQVWGVVTSVIHPL